HGNIMLLIVGGNDTTRSTISASVVAFDRYPAELAKLRARSGLIGNLAPELMRWQTPVAHMRRTAMRDVTVGGCPIARGHQGGEVVSFRKPCGRHVRAGGRLRHRQTQRAPSLVLRRRRSPLHRGTSGRTADPGAVGGNPQALPKDRSARTATPYLLHLPPRL